MQTKHNKNNMQTKAKHANILNDNTCKRKHTHAYTENKQHLHKKKKTKKKTQKKTHLRTKTKRTGMRKKKQYTHICKKTQ